jgi:hypothetical protein
MNEPSTPGAQHSPSLVKERVQRLGLAWLPDASEASASARRLVLGVAAWSIYDVRLLALVGESVASGVQPDLRVVVFDVDEVPTSQGLQQLLPGVGEVFHTPAVGYWEGGELRETASGFAARELVGRLFGFDPMRSLE